MINGYRRLALHVGKRALYTAPDPFGSVIADVQITPMGVGKSVSTYVAACEKVFKRHNLICQLHAYGTNVEGDWEGVMVALKECHVVLHEMGAPRVSTAVKICTRIDKSNTISETIQSVAGKIT